MNTRHNGFVTFTIIWSGQLVSTIGSGLTRFGLGVWIFQETGSVTLFALNILAITLPGILIAPIAGVIVDRFDRRKIMLLADSGAGLSTLALALLLWFGDLSVWHIYVITAANAISNTFQWPAYGAAVTMLVPNRHLGRAGGMVQIGEAISLLAGPALAGALFVSVGLSAIIAVDFITFGFAVLTLARVRIPQPEKAEDGSDGKTSFLQEATFGWHYIVARPGLLGILIFFAFANFAATMVLTLFHPMILNMTTPDTLGYMSSIAAVGMLLGTLLMSVWGGTRRRVFTIILFDGLAGVFLALMGIRPSLTLITAGFFGFLFTAPITNGASQALWQTKVAPDVQGRVFAIRRMIAQAAEPLAIILAGPLAERVFEPLFALDGPLTGNALGKIIGTGPGRGVGFMFVMMGTIYALATIAVFAHPRVRRVDLELPDVRPADEKESELPSESIPESVTTLS